MQKFTEERFNNFKNKLDNFTIKINNNLSYDDNINRMLISFKDFLCNFYSNNEKLYEYTTYDNYYIKTGNNILDDFDIVEFNNFKDFLVNHYNSIESITAECIYLENK